MIMGARDDGTVTSAALDQLYATLPATAEGAFVELAGGGHGFPTRGNSQVTRRVIPRLKTFIDNDTRYTQFLCPSLVDSTGISRYRNTCPCVA
ncbi:hypothetical protein RM590_33450 [Streptomyces sp. DSM 44938]|uniref:PET hydrolase/cutinase-like domain-containing protein n=1 Tax=Streptomyces litchfieldiae TaxID=3075543 RepID=A0ABU2N1G4_9ACTN|nr:hypothetical protein [Streptomyces sp. DSM 44938]MDT0347442.1 hypothetical protein [Streptomyces sp. DSM 44938]